MSAQNILMSQANFTKYDYVNYLDDQEPWDRVRGLKLL